MGYVISNDSRDNPLYVKDLKGGVTDKLEEAYQWNTMQDAEDFGIENSADSGESFTILTIK